jgi:hypothetical protein
MCDYSLGGLPNRLAVQDEELIVHRFPTHSIGLASSVDLQPRSDKTPRDQNLWGRIKNFVAAAFECPSVPAVCIPPGATLMLRSIPQELQQKWSVGEDETVLFTQTSAEVNTYRDAICFRNGCQVSLQLLSEGISVRVVSLGGDSVTEPEPAITVLRSL